MANSVRDENRITSLLGALDTDGKTTVAVKANPATHRLSMLDGTTGADHGPVNSPRDDDRIPVLLAVSRVDGVTPVVVYANAAGQLLVQST